MSQKITSKNLAYDSSLPPFLAALRAQASGAPGPDPLLAQQRRAGKKRSSSEEAEDAPLVVDEDGNVVQLNVDKDGELQSTEETAAADFKAAAEPSKSVDSSRASIGGRKRKVGKVIGEAANEETSEKAGADGVSKQKQKQEKQQDDEPPKERKPKKKAKKIKLSFDDEDGG